MIFFDDEKPSYLVGQRALDSAGGGSAFRFSPGIGHEHFIRSDGAGNFGFGPAGVFTEQPSALAGYELTPKYGAKRYDAALLEMARQSWYANHDDIDEVAGNMGLWDEGMPNMHRDYNLIANNCKHYVQWLDAEYERLRNQYPPK